MHLDPEAPELASTTVLVEDFLPERIDFRTAQAAAGHPFAAAVFATPGVRAIFGVNDFVTVTRNPDGDWDVITPAVQAAAAAHL